MKKWIPLFLLMIFLSFSALGCAGTKKDTTIRCPKCGTYYDTRQGEETFDWMRGR